MDHAVGSVSEFEHAAVSPAPRRRLNWRLMLALAVNGALWAAIIGVIYAFAG